MAALTVVVLLVLSLALFGAGDERATAASTPSLYNQELVQGIDDHVSPAVVKIRADLKLGPNYSPMAVGSGILIDDQGYAATDNHVIAGADRIPLEFEARFTLEAWIVGVSLANDLALLKVDLSLIADIRPVEFGDY